MTRNLLLTLPLLLILLSGTAGYVLLEDKSLIDGLYLTVITITTVGYGDVVPTHPAGRIFTVFLAVAGVGYVMYLFSHITESIVEGGMQKFLGRKKMDHKIAMLNRHYIVCGFGRIGREICAILHENNREFVVIEKNREVVGEIDKQKYLAIEGEASDDDVLLKAGIEDAHGLIAVVSSDADNLYITLTARGLNNDLFILSRSSGVSGVGRKLRRAGASRVISPYSIGARRMAQLIVRPTVMDFIDFTMQSSDLGLRMEEVCITKDSVFSGKTLMESGIRKKYDIIVVAIKRVNEAMTFNPKPDSPLMADDILILLGEGSKINELEKEL